MNQRKYQTLRFDKFTNHIKVKLLVNPSTTNMVRVTLSLVILSLCAFFANGQDPHGQCPEQEVIQPCLCKRFIDGCGPVIECSGFKANEDLEMVLARSGDYPFTVFTVSNVEIDYIPADSLERKQIKFLSIANSSLVSIFNEIPPESSLLQALTFQNLTLQHGLRWELLHQLHALRALTVSRVALTKIDDTFGLLLPKQVRLLDFSRTRTTELGKNVFAPLRNLNMIVVRNNQIKTIERTMFPTPYLGTLLDFSYNKIQQLPEYFFTEMPHLTSLLLNNNNVATFSEKVFAHGTRTVPYMPLRDNPIMCDCKMKWLTEPIRKPYFAALCFQPDNLKGVPLIALTGRDFMHC